MTITECKRKNTCYDCDNERCLHHGKKEADCPKYRCDRQGDGFMECEHCAFIDRFIDDIRRNNVFKTNITEHARADICQHG